MAKLEPFRGGYYLWRYLPSIPAAAVFAVLFLIVTTGIARRTWKTRNWFCTCFAIGGLFEVIGYIGRMVSHDNTGKLMPFAIQNTFILLAPVLFAASIYMTLGRVIRSVNGEKYSIVRPRWLTRIFVTGDVLALTIQGSAAGMMVISDLAKLGEGVVIGGLVFQVIVFGIFWLTALLFHMKMRQNPMAELVPGKSLWQRQVGMLYGVSALIMARNVFRVVEFAMGHEGYLLSTEWPLYVFDAVPMLGVMVIFWTWFPPAAQNADTWSEADGSPLTSLPK